MTDNSSNFGIWLNEPTVQDAVVAALLNADQPILLREVALECRVQISSANRVLCRLHKKGLVTRYKLPVQGHPSRYGHKPCLLCTATRLLYLYTKAEGLAD